jgi:hypothetical protein
MGVHRECVTPLPDYAIDVPRASGAFQNAAKVLSSRSTELPLPADFDGGLGGGSGEEAARRLRLSGDSLK